MIWKGDLARDELDVAEGDHGNLANLSLGCLSANLLLSRIPEGAGRVCQRWWERPVLRAVMFLPQFGHLTQCWFATRS
jgi:hypothetical protein